MNMRRKQIILVDHNERSQAPDGIDNAEILEIIDHHRLGSLETMAPVFFRNQPLGCTATIIYQFYREMKVEIEPEIAGLLCAAIVSDTLMYRSPTCTWTDQAAAEELAQIAGIDVKEFAKSMFAAGSGVWRGPDQLHERGGAFRSEGKAASLYGKSIQGIGCRTGFLHADQHT